MILPQKLFETIDGRRTELVITLSSDQVVATLLYFSSKDTMEIIGQSSGPVQLHSSEETFDSILSSLVSVCEGMSLRLGALFEIDEIMQDHQRIHDVSIYVSDSMVKHHISSQEKEFDVATDVQQDQINEMINFDIPQGHSRVDTIVTSVIANGYSTTTDALVQNKVKTLGVTALDSYIRFDHMESIYQVISTQFNIEQEMISFYSLSSTLMSILTEEYKPQGNFGLLSLHTVGADAMVFNQDKLQKVLQSEYGLGYVENAVVEAGLVSSHEQFISLMEMYQEDHMQEENKRKLVEVVSQAVRDIKYNLDNERGLEEVTDWYVAYDEKSGKTITNIFKEEMGERRVVHVDLPKDRYINASTHDVVISHNVSVALTHAQKSYKVTLER